MTTLPPIVAAPPTTTLAVPSVALYRAEVEAALLKLFLDMPVVSATVVARTPQGATVVTTARGEVTIPNGPDLPPGTEVAVRVVSEAPLTISLRAQPRAEAAVPPVAAPTVLVEQGPLLAATLVRPSNTSLPAGTRLAVRILALELPTAAIAAEADQPQPDAAAKASSREVVATASLPAKPGEVLGATIGSEIPSGAIEVDASTPTVSPPPTRTMLNTEAPRLPTSLPAAPTALQTARAAIDPDPANGPPLAVSPSPSAAQEELVARVVRQAPGVTMLSTPVGLLSVQGLKAPEEALVRFVFAAPPVESRDRARAPVRHAWSALGEALRVLETGAPRAAERLAADLQPRNPENLAATVRMLAAAQRESAPPSVAADVGDTLAALGHAELAKELHAEFAAPRATASGAAADGWHVVAFPIHDGASLRPAHLYIEEEAARGRRAADAPSRFILEVGTLQFDGRLRPRRFDLLLRSRTSLRDDMRSAIERIFRGTVDACGWTGEIAFSTVPAFPAGVEQLRVSA